MKKSKTASAREEVVKAAVAWARSNQPRPESLPREAALLAQAVGRYEEALKAPKRGLDADDMALLRRTTGVPLYPRKSGPGRERAERLFELGYLKRVNRRSTGFIISAKGSAELDRRKK